MQYLGVEYSVKHMPELDPDFIPFGVWLEAYARGAEKPLTIALERDQGKISVRETKIHGTPEMAEADYRYVERYVKFLLWSVGGFRIWICGDSALAQRLQRAYTLTGERAFDVQFMQDVYEVPFEVIDCTPEQLPQANESSVAIGGHMEGCRIGFDAGGSDRKVSAVIDGRTVYSEEVVWHPKTEPDPQYHFDGIVEAFRTAASKMPRVDGIGVSSAGVFIGNSPMVSALFLKVPREKRELVKTIYDRAAREIGDVPIVVANDGDVTALAGAMGLECGSVMGMAMGIEAVAMSAEGKVLGWLELAFAPSTSLRTPWRTSGPRTSASAASISRRTPSSSSRRAPASSWIPRSRPLKSSRSCRTSWRRATAAPAGSSPPSAHIWPIR
ncbi:MAG: hypothetical protein ACLVGX_00270 [Oscillospiraceae bacterium]